MSNAQLCRRALFVTRNSLNGTRNNGLLRQVMWCTSVCNYSTQEKKLFTPGPLSTSLTVRQAAVQELGSRDTEFVNAVKYLRSKLIEVAGVKESDYTCIPVQGSGTFAVESVIQTTVPKRNGKMLILENGAYGKRIAKICQVMDINAHVESFPENEKVNLNIVEDIIKEDSSFTLASIIHCETSSGVFNPAIEVGQLIKQYIPDCIYFVDAMSSFGAVPLDLYEGKIDFVVSSANKCLQGIPGFSYVIANKEKLQKCKGNSRSLSLDLYDQHENLEKTGQFRFTPPTHCMLAFKQALLEFEQEGGVEARAKRYKNNREILRQGMKKFGFEEFLADHHEGYIITSFKFPDHPNFDFKIFYEKLSDKGQVIYPGKVLNADCFRIGTIGHIFPKDVEHLLNCIEEVCKDMRLPIPLNS